MGKPPPSSSTGKQNPLQSQPQNQANQKQPKPPPIPRQTFSRINFLYQASTLLALPRVTSSSNSTSPNPTNPTTPLSTFYTTHLLALSRKSVLRLDPSIKRTICKRCEALLIPGVGSCTVRLENRSKGGKKGWADVLVIECGCGGMKRFPVGMGRRRGKGGKGESRVDGGTDREEKEKEGYRLWTEGGEIVK